MLEYFCFILAENFGNDEGEPLEIPAGDGTGRNPEDVRNENEENGQFTISQGDSTEENQEDVSGNHDEVSEQSNIGQIDATKQYPKNVLNKVEESKESNNSQDEAAKKNQNIWNEDEVSELSNMEQGGTTDKAPDVPNKDEEFESKRSNISQDEATKKNQNIEQGGAIDRTSEEVPNKDEDSRQTKILQDEANKKNQNISNEESDQSNIAPGEAIEGNSKKDPTQEAEIRQFNTAHGDGAEQILKDITNENEESGKSNIPQQRSPNFSAQRNGSESNVQAEVAFNKNSETTTSNEATEMMDVDDNQLSTSGKQEDIEEDPSSKNVKAENLHNIDESHIMDDNDAAFNALLDSKDTSKHVTSKSPGEDNEKENDAMEINNDQLSTSDAQQHHEQDFLQNDPEGEVLTNHDDKKNGVEDGQCGESDILQKDAQSDLLQSLDEESLAHLAIKQDFYNKTDEERMKVDFKKDEDKTGKDDRGLDGNQQETFQDDTTVKNFGKHGSNNDEVEYDAALVEKVTVDEQSKMSQNDVGNNLDLEEHSTDTNKHVKTTSPGANNEKEIDGIDINDQISTSDSQEHYKHDFLQNDPEEVLSNHDDEKNEVEEGQCGQSDIVRKDDQNVLKQNSHEGFLTHLLIKQDVLNKANKERIKTDFEKDEGKTAKNIGELDGNLQETSEENTTVEIFDKHGSDKEKANTKLVSDVFGDKQPKIAHNDVGSNQDVEERTKNDFEKDEDKDGGKLDGDNGVKSNIVDATVSLSSEPTGGNRLDKNESNRRSIFDPLDISEPKTKIGTKTGNDAKENETNNEGKNSQDNKPDLPDPKLEELSKTTQVEKTHSDNGMGNEIAGDNPNQDGPGTSTIEIGKAEEEDFQNTTEEKLSQSQSEHNEKKTRGCLPFNIFKKRKRSKSQNYNEDKEKKVSIEDGEHGDIQSIGKKRKDVEVSGVDVAKKGDEKENWRSRISRKRKEKMDRKKKEKH